MSFQSEITRAVDGLKHEACDAIRRAYDDIFRTLTDPTFDKSFSGLKFASMEKDLVGRKALDMENWFRETVKKAAIAAGMSETDAQLYWSKVYCVIPAAMPEITYIDASKIDAITSTRKIPKRSGMSNGNSGRRANERRLTDYRRTGPFAIIQEVFQPFLGSPSPHQEVEVEETVIDTDRLKEICGSRKKDITECFEKWLHDGCRLAIDTWPE